MGWFRRRRQAVQVARETRDAPEALLVHLTGFITSRRGVEAWVEQPNSFNKPSILLVAADGESTRRVIPSVAFGYGFAADHDIPVYDAGVVPYPGRMREYEASRRRAGRPITY